MVTLEEWIRQVEESLGWEREHLVTAVTQFGRTVGVVGEKVAKGSRLNSLGEFQSAPISIDCRMASIQARADLLADLKLAVLA